MLCQCHVSKQASMRTTSEREEPLRASAPIAIHLPPSLPLPLRFRRRPLDGSRVQISLSKYNPSRFDGERVCPERARAAFHYAAGQVPLSSPLPSSGSLAAASLGLSSSRGRADGLPFRKAGEREKERGGRDGRDKERAKKRTKPKCATLAERERRKVTAALEAAAMAESGNSSKCGGGAAAGSTLDKHYSCRK